MRKQEIITERSFLNDYNTHIKMKKICSEKVKNFINTQLRLYAELHGDDIIRKKALQGDVKNLFDKLENDDRLFEENEYDQLIRFLQKPSLFWEVQNPDKLESMENSAQPGGDMDEGDGILMEIVNNIVPFCGKINHDEGFANAPKGNFLGELEYVLKKPKMNLNTICDPKVKCGDYAIWIVNPGKDYKMLTSGAQSFIGDMFQRQMESGEDDLNEQLIIRNVCMNNFSDCKFCLEYNTEKNLWVHPENKFGEIVGRYVRGGDDLLPGLNEALLDTKTTGKCTISQGKQLLFQAFQRI